MRTKQGGTLFLVAALLLRALPVEDAPVSRAEEISATADNHGLKNPVMKAVSPPENTSHGLSNPRNENGTVTWDCIWFGNYWQEDTNGDGVADENDKKQPVKWRVLSVDGDDAFLLADMNLDVQKYQDITDESVTWETCTMRSWLNDIFLNDMFTKSEQEMIKVTDVIDEGNPKYSSIERGNDTQDKLYLLSYSEVMNPKYGFASTFGGVETREAVNTAYVSAKWENKSERMETWSSIDDWWLRSLGGCVYNNSNIQCYGGVNTGNYYYANTYSMAVRPVLHLNLSSNSEWEKAGTISSVGGEMAATWDCIYFGNYRQGFAGWQTWKEEPIKWRVLSVDGDDAFLLADTNLDVQQYNNPMSEVTWETCTMRTWLNGAFLNKAFTVSEQEAIKVTDVINKDDKPYGIAEGNDTQDKVYLLSLSEVTNPQYGFDPAEYASNTRSAEDTAYVTAGGEMKGGNMVGSTVMSSDWWLRSSGFGMYTPVVNSSGAVNKVGQFVNAGIIAVRPTLHLNLSDTSVWSYADTVTSEKKIEEIGNPKPTTSSKPTSQPGGTQKPGSTQFPQASAAPGETIQSNVKPGIEPTVVPSVKSAVGKVSALKLKQKKNTVTASWKKLTGAKGYQICYSMSKKWKGKKQKPVNKNNAVIKNLKKQKTYYFRVRAYRMEGAKKVYGAWSSVKKINIKK